MCPDLVLKCRCPLLPSFRVSAPFLCGPCTLPARRRLPASDRRGAADPWGGKTQREVPLIEPLKPAPLTAAPLYRPAPLTCICIRLKPRQEDTFILQIARSLLVDNSSMEPAEWDGSKPGVPKLGSGDRRGSWEGRGGGGRRVQEISKQMKFLWCSIHLELAQIKWSKAATKLYFLTYFSIK